MVTLLREPARPTAIREHPLAPWFAVATVCFGAFMGQLDASVVTVAFPALQRQFGTGLAATQWVSLAYLLVLTALLVPAGRWSDRAGRKLLYLYGFVVFSAASAACGFAPSLGVLIALRVVQAGGAALLQANSVALVVTSVPARARRAALGVQAAAQAVGLACGPVVGGVLVGTVGWRWVFLINVPVGLLAVVAGWYLLPRTRRAGEPALGPLPAGQPGAGQPGPEQPGAGRAGAGRVGQPGADLGGIGLLAVSASTGMLAISSLSGLGLPLWAVAACVAASATAGAALVRHSRRAAAPLLDLRALTAAGAGPALGGALCAYLVLFGPLVLFPQVVSARGGSAASAGLLLTALPAGFGLAAVAVDRLIPACWPNRRRCVVGGALAAASAAALAVPAPAPVSVAVLGLLGVGLGIYTPANNAEIMASVPARDAAAAGGMVNMTRGIGTALGVAVVSLGLHVGTFLRQPDAGLTLSMAALAAVALVGVWCGQRGGQRGGQANLSPPGEPAGGRWQARGGWQAGGGRQARGDRRRFPKAGDTAPPPDGLAEGIARLRRALRRGARVADPGNTLAVAQFELLAALAEHPGARPGHLARLLNMRPNTVTTIVNALSSRGMLDRVTAAGDRRAVELTVTEAGRQAVLAWQATNAAVLHLALSTLPARQRRALAAAVPALDALARAIDRLADHADHADHADASDPLAAQADPD